MMLPSENLTKYEPEETKKSDMENVEMPEVSAEMDKIAQEIESMPEILKHGIVEKLKGLGYKVETGCPMNDPYWIISWK